MIILEDTAVAPSDRVASPYVCGARFKCFMAET